MYDDSLEKKQSAHIVVRPQLETAGADAEDTGEKLIGREELRDVKVLGQVWELFSQISRFLWERHSAFYEQKVMKMNYFRDFLIPFARPLPVIGGSNSRSRKDHRNLCQQRCTAVFKRVYNVI